jgi:DNA-binding HxlR family transcriptional regulator
MPKKPKHHRRSGCPISIALEILGDAWSLLIVRDMMFKGRTTFDAFQKAGEGIATNILADRLTRREGDGILVKHKDPLDARSFVYRLTQKGIDLAPMLVELILWSARYEKTDAPRDTVKTMAANPAAFAARIIKNWQGSAAI